VKFKEYLQEIAALPIEFKDKNLYHGTDTIKAGESIFKCGYIIAPEIKGKKNKMTPVEGRVYLTPDLKYAVIYTIGANMLGEDLSHWLNGKDREDKFGYLFVIDKNDISDVQPDEDSIGEMISNKSPEWLFNLAKKYLTNKQFKNVMSGECDDWASAGKKLVKKMVDWQKLELITLGSHIANNGKIKFSEAWKFDKNKCEQLKRDGSNFFKLAERIK
jgi:hypothetical protein